MSIPTPTGAIRRAIGAASPRQSICAACRRSLLSQQRRPFAQSFARRSTPELHSYKIDTARAATHLVPPPRNSGANAPVPRLDEARDSLPRLHETRPPQTTRIEEGENIWVETEDAGLEDVQKRSSDALTASSSTAEAAVTQQESPPPPSLDPARTSATSTQPPESTSPLPTTKPPLRPSRLRAPRKAALILTPSAVSHLTALLAQPTPQHIKVGVRNRGCSGLAYHLEYVSKKDAFDEVVEQDGVKVLIDSKALFSIIGSEMDWVEDKLNQRFVFRNPNIKEQCGCGESFMV